MPVGESSSRCAAEMSKISCVTCKQKPIIGLHPFPNAPFQKGNIVDVPASMHVSQLGQSHPGGRRFIHRMVFDKMNSQLITKKVMIQRD